METLGSIPAKISEFIETHKKTLREKYTYANQGLKSLICVSMALKVLLPSVYKKALGQKSTVFGLYRNNQRLSKTVKDLRFGLLALAILPQLKEWLTSDTEKINKKNEEFVTKLGESKYPQLITIKNFADTTTTVTLALSFLTFCAAKQRSWPLLHLCMVSWIVGTAIGTIDQKENGKFDYSPFQKGSWKPDWGSVNKWVVMAYVSTEVGSYFFPKTCTLPKLARAGLAFGTVATSFIAQKQKAGEGEQQESR